MVSPPVINVTAFESEAWCVPDAWGGGGGRCRVESVEVRSPLGRPAKMIRKNKKK